MHTYMLQHTWIFWEVLFLAQQAFLKDRPGCQITKIKYWLDVLNYREVKSDFGSYAVLQVLAVAHTLLSRLWQ